MVPVGEVTMPTLTTQSIGIAGSQITASQHPSTQARVGEANNRTALQRRQTFIEAVTAATQIRTDKPKNSDQPPQSEEADGPLVEDIPLPPKPGGYSRVV